MDDDHEKPAREATLDQITAALQAVDGHTPSDVLDAFIPKPATSLGRKLIPLTAGHELLLSQFKHPLSAGGGEWEDADVLLALFIFSTPSIKLFGMVEDDTFQSEFLAFVDSIPPCDIPKLGSEMVSHWMRSRATAIAMQSPHGSGQKKTAGSDGCSPPLARPARLTDGLRTWLSTKFRWLSCSH